MNKYKALIALAGINVINIILGLIFVVAIHKEGDIKEYLAYAIVGFGTLLLVATIIVALLRRLLRVDT